MREWTILVREKALGDPDLVAIPSGFSWGALLFQALWALYRKAWFTALVLLIIGMLVPLAGEVAGLAPGAMVVLQIARDRGVRTLAQPVRGRSGGKRYSR